MALIKIPKANMRLSLVNGIRLDIIIFFPWFASSQSNLFGLILFFLFFAIISEETMHMAVRYPRRVNGKTPSKTFSDPI